MNTHFHHGVEWSPQVREKLNTWESNEVLTSAQRVEIEETIDESNLRRMQELQNLFNKVEQLQKDNPLPLILAGDFNSTVHSLIYEEIIETYQLRDTMSTYFPRPYTWDSLKNKKITNIHRFLIFRYLPLTSRKCKVSLGNIMGVQDELIIFFLVLNLKLSPVLFLAINQVLMAL